MAKLTVFVEELLNAISLIIVVFLMFLTMGEVISRYVFNYPIPGHHEMVELCVPALAFLGIARLERKGGHINIDIVLENLTEKLRYLIECFFYFLTFSIVALIAIATFKNSMEALSFREATETLQIPIWPFRLSIAIGSLALCFRFIVSFVDNIRKIIRPIVCNE